MWLSTRKAAETQPNQPLFINLAVFPCIIGLVYSSQLGFAGTYRASRFHLEQ